MQLSLSGRLIEVQYRYCEMSVPDFMRFAPEYGYEAVELRATQITQDTTPAEVAEFREVADELGLGVSCLTPPGITNDDAGLERLQRFAGFAQTLGCDTLKVWTNDIAWMQRACDYLLPLSLTLAAQVHTGGAFETIDSCLATLRQLNRNNFGILYDPANLFEAGQDHDEEAAKSLGKHIRQLSVQNIRLASADEPDVWEHEGRHFCRCMLGDPGGLDYESVFRGLRAIGFDGYVTLNEPKPTQMEVESFARKAAEELRKLLSQ